MRVRALGLIAVLLLSLPGPVAAQDRTASQTTIQITGGNGASGAPAISGDERFDRVLAFQSDASNLVDGDTNGATDVLLVRNLNPDANASQPWRPSSPELVSRGLGGQPANGRSFGPAVDGKPGEPPTAPSCVAFVSDASNLVRGDTNAQPDAFVARLGSGRIERVSVGKGGRQSNGPTFDVTVDGTCSRVAFSARASDLGGGGRREVYVRYLSGPGRGRTVVASTKGRSRKPLHADASHPSYSSRVNGSNDKVAFQAGAGVYVHDFRKGRTRLVAGGGAAEPVISEQGFVVAYTRGGVLHTNDRGHDRAVSDPSAGPASDPSIGAGGFYVAYQTGAGSVVLWTAVRQLSLVESVGSDRQPLAPAGDPAVSSRANEVFFVHQGQLFARYLGGR